MFYRRTVSVLIVMAVTLFMFSFTTISGSAATKGDVDGNGSITTLDYLLIQRICVGTYFPTSCQRYAADINNDGKVTSMDYLLLKRYLVGTYTIEEQNQVVLPISEQGLSDNSISKGTARWSEVFNSHIFSYNNSLSLLHASPLTGKIYIDTYTKNYSKINSFVVNGELDYFGGFYSGEVYNYIVFGQSNFEENNNKEVLRVVKYNKNFVRISSKSIKGGEIVTVKPFHAGSLSMAEQGNILVIHTTRQRYKTPDGQNHQSQLTLVLDTSTMSILNNLGEFQDNHVSHSFNQHAVFDGDNIVLLDHGDAYPRSIVLHKSDTNYSFTPTNLFNIPGQIGANCTGVSTGGLEVSNSRYISVINTIDHNLASSYGNSIIGGVPIEERDVCVLSVPKSNPSTAAVNRLKITDYSGNGKTASSPYLVKINNNLFMVLWQEFTYKPNGTTECGDLKYIYINGVGNKVGSIQTEYGLRLSKECQPIVFDNKVMWYLITGGNVALQFIDISS